MDALQFAYWLQGFAELSGDTPPTEAQWQSIREHLGLVFHKVTPPVLPTETPSWRHLADKLSIDLSNPKCGQVIGPATTTTRC